MDNTRLILNKALIYRFKIDYVHVPRQSNDHRYFCIGLF